MLKALTNCLSTCLPARSDDTTPSGPPSPASPADERSPLLPPNHAAGSGMEGRIRQSFASARTAQASGLQISDLASAQKHIAALKQTLATQGANFRISQQEREEAVAAYRDMVFPPGKNPARAETNWRNHYANECARLDEIVAANPDLKAVPREELLAMRWWTGDFIYPAVQNLLLDPPADAQRVRLALPLLKAIVSGLNALPARYEYEGPVFTGEFKDAAWVARYQPGQTMQDWSFFATAKTRAGAWQGGSIELETNSHRGKCIGVLSYNPQEEEVLFPPASLFDVLAVTAASDPANPNLHTRIRLEQATGQMPESPHPLVNEPHIYPPQSSTAVTESVTKPITEPTDQQSH
jgi:hypothetical protein